MIDGRNFFDQPIKNHLKTHDNIRKIATDQGDDYSNGCLLDYFFLKNQYKSIAINLSKQQELADPKAAQQINFTGNLSRAESATIFIITGKVKEAVLDLSNVTVMML